MLTESYHLFWKKSKCPTNSPTRTVFLTQILTKPKGKTIRCAYKEHTFKAKYDVTSNKVWFRGKYLSLSGAGNEVKRIVNEKLGFKSNSKLTTCGPKFWFWLDNNKSIKQTYMSQKLNGSKIQCKNEKCGITKKVRGFWSSKGCIIWRFVKGGNSLYSIVAQIWFKNMERRIQVRQKICEHLSANFANTIKRFRLNIRNSRFMNIVTEQQNRGFHLETVNWN